MPQILRFRALNINPAKFINYQAASRESEAYVREFLDKLVEQVRTYPPNPSGSEYERTWQLGMGWRVNVNQGALGIEGRITNVATDRKRGRRYMPYVQGAWQAGFHAQHGWKRIDELAVALRPQYRKDLQAIYKKHMGGI